MYGICIDCLSRLFVIFEGFSIIFIQSVFCLCHVGGSEIRWLSKSWVGCIIGDFVSENICSFIDLALGLSYRFIVSVMSSCRCHL